MLEIPLVNITTCQFLQDPGSQASVLMVVVDNQFSPGSEPRTHFFQCARTPVSGCESNSLSVTQWPIYQSIQAEVICKEIEMARETSLQQPTGSATGRQVRPLLPAIRCYY